jgi:hypothetical protein
MFSFRLSHIRQIFSFQAVTSFIWSVSGLDTTIRYSVLGCGQSWKSNERKWPGTSRIIVMQKKKKLKYLGRVLVCSLVTDSSTWYGFPSGARIFIFVTAPTLVSIYTQPPFHWIPVPLPNGNHPQPEVSWSPPSGVEVKSGRICTSVPLVDLYGMVFKHWYAYLLQ